MTARRLRWMSLTTLLAGMLVSGLALFYWQSGEHPSAPKPVGRKAAKPRAAKADADLEGKLAGSKKPTEAPVADRAANPWGAAAPSANPALKRNKSLAVGERAAERIRLSGVVVDTRTRAPLEAVRVRIAPILEGVSPAEMESRKDGTFSLAVPQAPRYEVRASAEGYRGYSQTGLVADSSRSDLVLELSPYWNISGVVLDEKSHPVEGAAVWVRSASQTPRQAKASSRTDRRGRFVVEGWIGAGSYLVGASHSSYRSQDPVRLEVPQQLEATLHLRSAPLEERGSLSGRVTDAKGLPVDGAKLNLINAEDFMTLKMALTGADGFYKMSEIRSGSYTVSCRAEGFSGGSASNFKDLKISAGQMLRVDFSLQRPSFLDGVLHDEEGLPVVRAMVKLKVNRGGGRGTFSDSEGRFAFQDIPPGSHTVSVTHRDFLTHEEVLSFPGSGEYRVVLKRGVSLGGVVRDLSGAPIPRFKLSMILEGANRALKSARFDSDQGDFILSGLLPGRYRLEMSIPQAQLRWGEIELQESKQVLIFIDLGIPSAPLRILEEGLG